MGKEREIKRKSLSIKRVTKKTQGKTKAIDVQTSSQVNLRVAISQMNSVVGDFEYNANRVENSLKEAHKYGVDLILFPELTLTGYPPEDLLLKDDFIAKNKKIRNLVHNFQVKSAYHPPKKYNGSCLDGRDITYKIIPDANFKFFITANIKTRALRRYKELKQLKKKISFNEVLKSIKKRDKSDYNRRISPLKKTQDSILINTTNLTKRACFLKIKSIMDRKLNN